MKLPDNEKIIISTEYPSHIIEDFRTYLDYLKTHEIKLTRSKGYFTKNDLISLYSQMKGENKEVPNHATQLGYPILHLFYQLSIVLDLIKVRRTSSSASAVIQQDRIDSFMALTATEQYISLLEAFWTEADWEELQGELRGRVPRNIDYLFEKLEPFPANQSIELNRYDDIEHLVSELGMFFYYFSHFGFWTFTIDEEKINELTSAKAIKLTPFFKKIQEVLYETWEPHTDQAQEQAFAQLAELFGFPDVPEEVPEEEETGEPQSLVSLLSPFFPREELSTTLKKKEPSFKAGSYLFKVSLGSSCWRTLKLSSSHTLLDLHNVIQEAFEFNDDHLYAFYMDGVKFGKHYYNSPMDVSGPYVQEVKIGSLDLDEGQSFLYLFDFGDEWEFFLHVLAVNEEGEGDDPQVEEELGDAPDQYDW